MRKLLAAGAIASVALGSANAGCVNGGFYIQGSFGMSMTKMKYKNNLENQYHLLKKGEIEKMEHFKLISAVDVNNQGGQVQALANANNINAIPGYEDCVWWQNLRTAYAATNATETSLKKRKGMFQFELGFGVDKRLGDAMIGIDVNFGKNFGNIKKKVKGLAYTKYTNTDAIFGECVQVDSIGNGAVTNQVGQCYGVFAPTKTRIDINYATIDNLNQYIYDTAPQDSGDMVGGNYILSIPRIKDLPLYDPEFALEFRCKNKFYISIMPRIGMLLNPRTELYVTFGMKIKGDKYTIRDVANKKSGNKSVTKCIPSFGFGLRHTFESGVFVKLEYNKNLNTSKTFKKLKIGGIVIDETTKHTVKNSSSDIKFGFGRKF